MSTPSSKDITLLLADWGNGGQAVLDELIPLVYGESRSRIKRGGGVQMVSLAEQGVVSNDVAEVIALDDALNNLA